ncbi:ATP-binding cassette domain-containing protein [Phormidium sp. FACHB-592]|uniref:ATP-binding cassette domain-containing protein n=1 Tax=Stenomitos frigidus AS-A4 TaxID=2933935 RepID=A0ABV0KMR4_9CYAN|nr:ATP-binding cassette domain-containing protein [Phormidium sp. FACHB-592]MBD2077094.1 ATP-binding cassette domain-containing protein [Phormidium sp. FACHB-592]
MLSLTKLYSGYASTPVLRNITLSLAAGEIIAIVGRNGAGKTTLLKTIMGLLPVQAGKIMLDGKDITLLPAHQRVNCGFGYVPQGHQVFPTLSVREHLLIGQHSKVARTRQIEWLFDLFPMLYEKQNDRADQLSGGQQQQLAIACALISNPRILLLDEPLNGIQLSLLPKLVETLKQVNQNFCTAIILVEQDLDLVLALTQQTYILVKGELVDRFDTKSIQLNNTLLHKYLSL